MLELIFEHGSNEDRRNIRLVCKRWFKICNRSKFLQLERLTYGNVYCTSQIFSMLQRSERKLFRLKFKFTRFKEADLQFFSIIGLKIWSLNFFDCSFEENVLENIITICQNLLQLSLKFQFRQKNVDRLRILLNYLTRRNIIKSEVIFLDIEVPNLAWLDTVTINQIFRIFPNLQHFKIVCPDVSADGGNAIFTNICTEIRSLQDRIKELSLGFKFCPISPNILDLLFTDVTSLTK